MESSKRRIGDVTLIVLATVISYAYMAGIYSAGRTHARRELLPVLSEARDTLMLLRAENDLLRARLEELE